MPERTGKKPAKAGKKAPAKKSIQARVSILCSDRVYDALADIRKLTRRHGIVTRSGRVMGNTAIAEVAVWNLTKMPEAKLLRLLKEYQAESLSELDDEGSDGESPRTAV